MYVSTLVMRFGKKGENDERMGLNGWEPLQDPPTCPCVPYIVRGSLLGLNKNPQKIVNWNFQIVHGTLCGFDKTIKSCPDSYAFPDVSYAPDLQVQGTWALQFFILKWIDHIFRFPNDPCDGNASKNGTCYTSEECSAKGGTSSGSCASGYGVCCTCNIYINHIFWI